MNTGNTHPDHDIIRGEILDEAFECDLESLCRICHLQRELIVEMVELGMVDPRGRRDQEWRFTGIAVRRAQIASRLHRELGVNLAGAALALDLLEELESLRQRLGLLA